MKRVTEASKSNLELNLVFQGLSFLKSYFSSLFSTSPQARPRRPRQSKLRGKYFLKVTNDWYRQKFIFHFLVTVKNETKLSTVKVHGPSKHWLPDISRSDQKRLSSKALISIHVRKKIAFMKSFISMNLLKIKKVKFFCKETWVFFYFTLYNTTSNYSWFFITNKVFEFLQHYQ